MKSVCVIAMSLVLFAGCAKQIGNLVIRDAAGNVVATGDLRLPDPLPPVGETFEGRWRLEWSGGSFPAGAAASGKYGGRVDEHQVSIDLNPGMADNNVLLSGSLTNGSLSGKWHYATIAGAKEMGSFTVASPTDEAR